MQGKHGSAVQDCDSAAASRQMLGDGDFDPLVMGTAVGELVAGAYHSWYGSGWRLTAFRS
jgi:hypothetical protein